MHDGHFVLVGLITCKEQEERYEDGYAEYGSEHH